jgi:MFS family permease
VYVIAGWFTTRMRPDPVAPPATSQHPARRPAGRLSGPVLVLGAIAFASMLCEGATADWASVYLRGSIRVSPGAAGLGYTVFALMMLTVRLAGNRLLTRFPRRRLLPALAAVATIGFTAGLLGGDSATVIAGFGFLGIGLALIVPSVNSAAGRLPGLSPGAAIAMVSAWGWARFVFGPPVIGQLASANSLTAALGMLPALTACIVFMTARARVLCAREPGRAPVAADVPATSS